MIVPTDYQASETRRVPWITVSLIALCFATWIATLVAQANVQVLPPSHYREQALRFWEEHPYLEMDRPLAFYLLEKSRPDLFEAGAKPQVSDGDLAQWFEEERLRASFGAEGRSRDVSELRRELARLTQWGFELSADEMPPDGGYLTHRFGLIPAQTTLYGFLSHIFVHTSWAHLLGNLFLLFLIAPALEARWGRPIFAGFLLTAGLFAGGFFTLLSRDSDLPLVGASGVIAAVLGSFLVLHWQTKMKFSFFFLPPAVRRLQLAAWVALPLWCANEMLRVLAPNAAGLESGAAYWAQAGGLLFGGALALCVRGLQLEEKYLNRLIDWNAKRSEGKDTVAAARRALATGQFEEAFTLFQQESSSRPNDLDSVLGYWQAGVACSKPHKAAMPLVAWIRAESAKGGHRRAADVWCQAIEIEPVFPVDGATLVKLAPVLAKIGRGDSAVKALRYVLSNSNPSLNAVMALRAREIAATLDPATELLALHQVLALAELPVEKEEGIRARVVELESRGVEVCPDPFGGQQNGVGEPVPVATPSRRKPLAAQPARRKQPAPHAAEDPLAYDPLGLRDGRAIEIDLADDSPSVVRIPSAGELPAAVEEADMSYFGDNSADMEPLALADTSESAGTIGQPLAAPPSLAVAVASPVVADLDVELGGPVAIPRFREAKRSDVVPVELASDHVVLETGGGNLSRLALDRIQAVACAVIEDLAAKPIVIVDLLLNWRDADAEVLQVVRLQSNDFDPRALVPGAKSGLEALRDLAVHLLGGGADPLPSSDAVSGQPFARFSRLVDYERDVLAIASN